MDSLSKKTLKLVVLAITACSLIACDRHSEGVMNQDSAAAVFSDLRLIRIALHFPYTQEELARCEAIDDEQCLKVYSRVKDAKSRLFSLDREQALQLTLDTISAHCAGGSTDEDSVCGGAATALYFFPASDDDKVIQAYFYRLPPPILGRVVELDNAWLLNRSDKQKWREWVHTLEMAAEDRSAILSTLDAEWPQGLSIDVL